MSGKTSDAFSVGFGVAEVSVDLFDDDRMRKIARKGDVDRTMTAMTVYLAVVLASWKEGRRARAEDAVPLWLPLERLRDADEDLRGVGLLDRTGRIPSRTWSRWYVPVAERRARNRERWARYNASRTGGTAEVPRGSDAATRLSDPIRSDPIRSVPSRPREGATGRKRPKGEPTSVGEILEGPTFAEAMAMAGYAKDPESTK